MGVGMGVRVRVTRGVAAAALVSMMGCVVHRPLPEWEAISAADVAFDSLPPRRGRICPPVMTTGDGGKNPGLRMTALVSRDSTGGYLETAVLAKAPAAFLMQPPRPMFRSPVRFDDIPCGGGGGSWIGPIKVEIWMRMDTVWVDSLAIPMRYDNVLLLDVDAKGRVRIAGRAHVRPRLNPPFPPPTNREERLAQMEADGKALMPLLRTSETVRRFLK